jgi:hypothetical protein
VAIGSLPAAVAALYAGEDLGWLLAALFVAGIFSHYVRLAFQRGSLERTTRSGACLLPVAVWIYVIVTDQRTPSFGLLCAATIPLAFLGAWAGFLTAVLIEATRLAWAGTWMSLRRRRRRRGKKPPASARQADDDVLPLEKPPSCFLPRRWGVRGMLVLVTLASVLMGFMQIVHLPPLLFGPVLLFVAGVLSGQVLFFRGRKPLVASAWVGALLLPGEAAIVVLVIQRWIDGNAEDIPTLLTRMLLGCAGMVPAGIVLGTVVGTAAGGVYTLTDAICQRLFKAMPRIDLLPFTRDDIDVLLAWIDSPLLLRRWAGGRFVLPLDRVQLERRVDATAGDHPSRLMFKAVSPDSGNMVAYVELDQIDPSSGTALVELPLVAPHATERDVLGVLLLRKLAERAFGELRLRRLSVRFDDREGELAGCCWWAWARKYDYVDITARDGSGIRYLGMVEPRPMTPEKAMTEI